MQTLERNYILSWTRRIHIKNHTKNTGKNMLLLWMELKLIGARQSLDF